MLKPALSDYVALLRHLFSRFEEEQPQKRRGPLYTYKQISLIVFFTIMTLKRIFKFKAQVRWLQNHPKECKELGFPSVPHRTTLSRRYKKLYETIGEFVEYISQWAEDLDEVFSSNDLFEDKSLFKAVGPVWHKKDRQKGIIPQGLRNLDTDASWSKSAYHGWVYGYGGHLTSNLISFPASVQVETACVSESKVIDQKADSILSRDPHTLTGDNNYCNLHRVRSWAKKGVALLTPALKVSFDSEKGGSYKRFIQQPENKELLDLRKTVIEPPFDLIGKLLGVGDNQKQVMVKGLANVRTYISLGVLLLQLAMIVNSIWGMPLHNISHMMAVFA